MRAAGLLVLLAAAGAIYGASASSAFVARTLVIEGATWTAESAVRGAIGTVDGANLFTLRAGDLETRLVTLPAVRTAHVSVSLPDAVTVRLEERVPLLIWSVGDRGLLVDSEGLVFAELPADPPAAAKGLAEIEDVRPTSAQQLAIGSRLDRVELDAALRLGSLRPADVGSSAPALRIRLDDTSGFVVHTGSGGWSAVFGFYTPTLRTTDLIAGQVRLLRSFLDGREGTVARIILADDRNGTFIPRVTPKPTAKPSTTPSSAPAP